MYVHEQFAWAGLGVGYVAVPQDLGTAMPHEKGCLHRCTDFVNTRGFSVSAPVELGEKFSAFGAPVTGVAPCVQHLAA